MKKQKILNISLITSVCLSSLSFSLVSCGDRNSPKASDVTLDDYWSINYHFSGRLEAPYQFNLLNCKENDEATITIKSQTVSGEAVSYLSVSSGAQQTIKQGQEHLDFKLACPELSDNTPIEIVAIINVTLKRNGEEIVNHDFNIYAEWAKPIPESELDIRPDEKSGKVTLYGFTNPESVKGKGYTMLYVPERVEVIADKAFYPDSSTIPSTVKWLLLDESWGRGESKLKEIGEQAFQYANLTDLTIFIPSSVETIKKMAFLMCTLSSSHTSLRFGSNSKLKIIGEQAFSNDYIYDQIILPRGLQCIEDKALSENNPQRLFIPNSLAKIDQAFKYGYKNLELIDMTDWKSLPEKGADAWIVSNLFNSEAGKAFFEESGEKAKILVSTNHDWISFFKECGLNESYWEVKKI